ncbi:MAG: hypothetical protein SOT60_08075 [Bilifractor sp.]|nr:hypothetical protein [Lachnospiraceae bacterium]MDY2837878.1 hypothetical protein [Bilifractor sp.]
MKKLLNYLILIKEITILYIMAAVWLIMDITIYHSFFLSPLMLGLTPVSTFAYYLLAGCVDYIRISPAYAKFIQKKYARLVALTMAASYLTVSLLCFLLQSLNISGFSVKNTSLVLTALIVGIYGMLCPLIYRTRIAGFILFIGLIAICSGTVGFFSGMESGGAEIGRLGAEISRLIENLNTSFPLAFFVGILITAAFSALNFLTIWLTRKKSECSYLSRNYLIRLEKSKPPKVKPSVNSIRSFN